MSQRIPIYIPTFISDQNYNPNRVLPRLYFFNGMVDCETYNIESGSLINPGVIKEVNQFPYFDHYNVITGSFPTTGSRSLLFNNEAPVYGQQPNETLFTEYWSQYVELLYNPKTRLINASAIIPLADYFDMELNDVINWRGDYYHLRAINDYNLKTGECKIQLLGPLLEGTLDGYTPPAPGPVESASVKIHLEEYNASPTAFFDLNVFANSQSYFFSGDFTQSVAPNTSIVEMEVAQNSPSQIWGPFTTASATLTITDNGSTIFNNTSTYTSGSATYSVTSSVNFQSGHTYVISASNQPTPTASLDFSISQSCYQNDGVVRIYNPIGGGGNYQFNEAAYFSEASALAATTNWVTTGSITFNDMPDGTLWFALRDGIYTSNKIAKSASINCNSSSTGCYTTASFTVGISTAEVFWIDCCGNGSSSFFEVGNHIISGCITIGSISSPDSVGNPEYYGEICSCSLGEVRFDWSFNESAGADGQMQLYINGSVVENRFNNSSGTYFLNVGDTIACEVSCTGCTSPNSYANAYTLSDRVVLVDADCSNGGTAGITTSTYTVVSGDADLQLSAYAACDVACV
jgi:hypothetical protein